MCSQERDGLQVKEDRILGLMRWTKSKIAKNPKNYRLVVCKECFLNYKKRHDRYERNQMLYIILGVLFLVALGIAARGSLSAIGFGIVILIFLYILAQLSYLPAVEMPQIKRAKAG